MMGCLGEIGIAGWFDLMELDNCARISIGWFFGTCQMFGFSKLGHESSCIILVKLSLPEGYF
jgi:hypothetical protein